MLARDGTPLAEGPAEARTSPLGASALAIAGSVGSPSRKQARELYALGYPPNALTGTSGLELAFNLELTGQPSGQLLAVPESGDGADERILASGDPVRGEPVKTTIDPDIQSAAVSALGGTYGGVAVLDARNGDVLGVAGLAFSAPQPPGSTFKVITATAGLEEGKVKPSDTFPVETSNSLIGREISNAHDAPCGGTFVQSFAQSCNTVFAPLGVEVGGDAMLETAEKFGFNSPTDARRARRAGGAGAARELLPQARVGRRGRRERHRPGPGDWRRRCRWLRSRRRSPTRACASRPRS